jgi:hypothetical protein
MSRERLDVVSRCRDFFPLEPVPSLRKLLGDYDSDACARRIEGLTWKEVIENDVLKGLGQCVFYMDDAALVYYLPSFLDLLLRNSENKDYINDIHTIAFALSTKKRCYELTSTLLNEDQIYAVQNCIADYVYGEITRYNPSDVLSRNAELIGAWFANKANDDRDQRIEYLLECVEPLLEYFVQHREAEGGRRGSLGE